MAKVTKPPIDYTSRDFDSIKKDLINFSKRYYPNTFKDFQESGFGSLFLDTTAYVGDILSFYLDYQVNESFLSTASEFNNVVKIAKQNGFNYAPNKTSTGIASFYILVPAITSINFEGGASPNLDYAPILKRGSSIGATNGLNFILTTDVNFADSTNEIVIASRDSVTGRPSQFAIKAFGRVISGKLKVVTKTVTDYKPFQKIILNDNSIVEIFSLRDSQGNEYYQVPNLAQDVIYRQIPNNGDDKEYVKFILQPKAAPRRFVLERESDRQVIQFGYGSEEDIESAGLNVVPEKTTIDMFGKNYVSDSSFDPNVILKSGKFGIAPSNTKITIVCRQNDNANVNLPVGSLRSVEGPIFTFGNAATDQSIIDSVRSTLEVENEEQIVGDISRMTVDEIKILASNSFFSQNRAVTAKDYENIAYNMPSNFGSIKRVVAHQGGFNADANIDLYVLAEDRDGNLTTATSTLKQNLKNWISNSKIMSDSVDIFDAKILNIAISFKAVAEAGTDKAIAMSAAKKALRDYFRLNPNSIGEAILVQKLINVVNEATGINDVIELNVNLKTGVNYSNLNYDLLGNYSSDGRKIFIPKNVIWEVKFPFADINGEVR